MSSVVNAVKSTLAISEATGLDIFHAVDILLRWLAAVGDGLVTEQGLRSELEYTKIFCGSLDFCQEFQLLSLNFTVRLGRPAYSSTYDARLVTSGR